MLVVQIFFKGAFRTNGGYMFDVSVTYDDKETQHRIIVGRDYYEFQGIEPEVVVERVLAFLTAKNVPRHTEGELAMLMQPCLCTYEHVIVYVPLHCTCASSQRR